jgi:hypothetical protein
MAARLQDAHLAEEVARESFAAMHRATMRSCVFSGSVPASLLVLGAARLSRSLLTRTRRGVPELSIPWPGR